MRETEIVFGVFFLQIHCYTETKLFSFFTFSSFRERERQRGTCRLLFLFLAPLPPLSSSSSPSSPLSQRQERPRPLLLRSERQRDRERSREGPMSPSPPPSSPAPLSSRRENNLFPSSPSFRIKASGPKLSASTATDEWALLVAYEAEKERKEGACVFCSKGQEKTQTFRLLRSC